MKLFQFGSSEVECDLAGREPSTKVVNNGLGKWFDGGV